MVTDAGAFPAGLAVTEAAGSAFLQPTRSTVPATSATNTASMIHLDSFNIGFLPFLPFVKHKMVAPLHHMKLWGACQLNKYMLSIYVMYQGFKPLSRVFDRYVGAGRLI